MQFDEEYFKGEYRNEFYIRPMVKRAWAANIEILLEIERLCQKHNIRWFVNCGTLLGAVREKGFIPWDDDIDISMLRPDYERFITHAKTELQHGIVIRNYRGDPEQSQPFAFVANSDIGINLENDFLTRYHGCPYAIGIDIFPLDEIPDDPEEDNLYRTLIGGAMDVAQHADKGMSLGECDPEIITEAHELCDICGINITSNKPIAPQMYSLADQLTAMYADSGSINLSVGAFYHCRPRFRISKEAFSEIIYMDFEGIQVPVMKGYDEVLKSWYGPTYMTPRQGHGMHEYPSFKKYEAILKNRYSELGVPCPELFTE